MPKEFDYDNYKWDELFRYDEKSPSKLVWNTYRYSFNGQKMETWPGKPAGSLSAVKNGDNKAYKVGFKYNDSDVKVFPVHRIIACLHGMLVNGLVIDHINGDSSDNRINNLRVVTVPLNSRNCKPQHNSPYGISGVGFQEDGKGNSYFVSRWRESGRTVQKSFPIKQLGVMEAFKQAVVTRANAITYLNTEKSAGYTERHSKEIEKPLIGFEEYKFDSETYAKNFRKQKVKSNNTSGVVGVSFYFDKKRSSTYVHASWKLLNGKQNSKKFSIRKLGLLPAFKAAVEYRHKMIEELNAQGAGYTENHGK